MILRHYREITGLCHAAAVTSGTGMSTRTLTDADIISVEFKSEQTDLTASPSDLAT